MDSPLTELVAAREITLSVLKTMTEGSLAERVPTEALVAVQEAANRLGVAESALQDLRAEQPAPILDPSDPASEPEPARWGGEASAVMALAQFTLPYADGPADEADRWLRVLSREGSVGRALTALGYPESELSGRAETVGTLDFEAIGAVRAKAEMLARQRGNELVTTLDVLFGVLARYGTLVERALYAHGITREALFERVSLGARAPDNLPA
jgi:hypothetical protein